MRVTWSFTEAATLVNVLPTTTGVYRILNLVNGKAYIGSASHIKRYGGFRSRWHLHIHHLLHGAHHAKHLQHAFTKYGQESFVFQVLEVCEPSMCEEREAAWIAYQKTHLQSHGYNFSVVGKIGRGWKHTDEAKEKIAAAKRGKRRSDTCLKKLKAFAATRQVPVTLEKAGKLFHAAGVSAFAREFSVNPGSLSSVLSGKVKSVSGFTLPGCALQTYTVEDPNGHRHTFSNINAFASQHGLNGRSFNRLANSKPGSCYRGWKLAIGVGFGDNARRTGKF